MKRTTLIFGISILAIATLVLAQTSSRALLRFPGGERQITIVQQGSQTYFSADEVLPSVGGKLTKDDEGYKASVNGRDVGFAVDSRYAIVGDEIIEMPDAPISIENRVFVPWQLFNGFLRIASSLEASWDPASSTLELKPMIRQPLSAQASLVDLQGTTKIVIQLSGKTDYSIVREPAAYLIRLRDPITAAQPQQSYENPSVTQISFQNSEIRITLASRDVVADAYRLENPFRIVLDLRQGTAPGPLGLPVPSLRMGTYDPPGVRTIVIDPGHGGKEVGAVGGGGLMEKDLTLAICRKLASQIEKRLKARVILTRGGDQLVSLDERTALANQYKADLFLSVHLNASLIKGARGSETYFLSLEASDELARKAAERENSSGAADPAPSSDLRMILWDLAQQEYLKESSRLAVLVQEEMNRATGVQSRGVKQAPFKVLVGATMPAALVEVGFISNPDEEGKLKSEAFQNTVATALTDAVARYKHEYEVRIGVARPAASPSAPAPAVGQSTPPALPGVPAASAGSDGRGQ